MINLTDPAKTQIDDYFQGRAPSPIRIFLNSGGWGGPSLAMALDEPKDTDEKFDIKGLQFVVDKSFMEKAEKINIDFNKTYVMVCQRGLNSYQATKMVKKRYPTVTVLSLTGGISNY